MNPRVKEVIPLPNYQLQLIFTNEEKKIYDCSPLLDFGIFQELKNKRRGSKSGNTLVKKFPVLRFVLCNVCQLFALWAN